MKRGEGGAVVGSKEVRQTEAGTEAEAKEEKKE